MLRCARFFLSSASNSIFELAQIIAKIEEVEPLMSYGTKAWYVHVKAHKKPMLTRVSDNMSASSDKLSLKLATSSE